MWRVTLLSALWIAVAKWRGFGAWWLRWHRNFWFLMAFVLLFVSFEGQNLEEKRKAGWLSLALAIISWRAYNRELRKEQQGRGAESSKDTEGQKQ